MPGRLFSSTEIEGAGIGETRVIDGFRAYNVGIPRFRFAVPSWSDLWRLRGCWYQARFRRCIMTRTGKVGDSYREDESEFTSLK